MSDASGRTTHALASAQRSNAQKIQDASKGIAQPRTSEWHGISEGLQTALAQQAMHQASLIVAEQAEMFAAQFDSCILQDRGAADALRLFSTLLRETSTSCLTSAGNA